MKLDRTDLYLVYYQPSRIASAKLSDELKAEFHVLHPKRATLSPKSVICPDCEKWFQSTAILGDHYSALHPDAATVEGIRRRFVSAPFCYWTPAHPMRKWFVGSFRADIRSKMSHNMSTDLGSVSTTYAPRSLIVGCLIRDDDENLTVAVDPVDGTSAPRLPHNRASHQPSRSRLLFRDTPTLFFSVSHALFAHRNHSWSLERARRP